MTRIQSILKQSAIATALAVATLATPAAFAHDQHRGHDRHHDQRHDRRDHRNDRRDYREYRKDVRQAYRQDQRNYRRWARGQYIPRDYLGSRYYINDYRTYRLAPPPRGYVWVRPYRDDGTYYMVQLATGLIAQALIR